jgi:16S rRNA processing protein RimM
MVLAAAPGNEQPPVDLLPVARLVEAYGIKGWVRLEPFSPDAAALFKAGRWWLKKSDQSPSLFIRQQIRWQGKSLVASFQGLVERGQAESLKGYEVLVSRQDFPALERDEYYWTDLIGCDVISQYQTLLGKVINVIDNGAHAILEIRNDQGEMQWVPFVATHVGRVDLGSRRIEACSLKCFGRLPSPVLRRVLGSRDCGNGRAGILVITALTLTGASMIDHLVVVRGW